MRPIRVLVLHNAYQLKGGEDSVVLYESEMLAENGNLAGVCLVTNTHINGILGKLRAALGVVFSLSSYRFSREKIRELHPCVVHVHNFFPLLSPSVFYACLAERVPVVFTLHNYRIICPTALLMHDGKVSERSLDEGPWWALRYRVYRG
jgi:glycosyltransferase involved in cell wall biosynthesis